MNNLDTVWNLAIVHNNSLLDLSGMNNLRSLSGSFISYITNNNSLSTLVGLENLSCLNDYIVIGDNPNLTVLTTFPNLHYINGTLSIINNDSLLNLNGFEELDSINGHLNIDDNNNLVDIQGLENLVKVSNSLSLEANYSLQGLGGLVSLEYIGGGLSINGCNELISLSGLDSLKEVNGNLNINENNSLQNLSGINNIESESIMNLSITYNPQLSTCEVQSVCDYLANPNGDIQIYVNATGCNNSVEVTEACTVGIPENASDTPLTAYPNPFTTSTTIEYELTEPSHVQLTIYNAIGEEVYKAEDRLMPLGKHTFIWTADRLPEGLYYAVLRSEKEVSVVKMVKQ